MDDRNSKRDLVLAPGEYAYMQDVTKGIIKTYTGPTVINPTAQERPVAFNPVNKQFEPCTLEAAVQQIAIAPESEQALRLTLERCQAEGIGAAIVLMPEAAWFRELLSSAGEGRVQALVADVSREFAVPVIDARGWCPDDEFRDGHHLIAAGATRFTERFGQEVMPLLTSQNASAKRR